MKPPIQPELENELDTTNFYPIDDDGSVIAYTVSRHMISYSIHSCWSAEYLLVLFGHRNKHVVTHFERHTFCVQNTGLEHEDVWDKEFPYAI